MANKSKSKLMQKAPTKREREDFARKVRTKRDIKEMTGSKSGKVFK